MSEQKKTRRIVLVSIIGFAACCFMLSNPASAQTSRWSRWYVDGRSGTDPTSCGSGDSWDTAFKTPEKAVQCADTGDEIWVKKGTYHLPSTLVIDKSLKMYGGFTGSETKRSQRNWKTHQTIFDGQASIQCLRVSADAKINGFQIRNGYDPVSAGGLYKTHGAAPTIENCSFLDNIAGQWGGAIFADSGTYFLINCTFKRNRGPWFGGAIYNNHECSPDIINCMFIENQAGNGGAIMNSGSSETKIINCSFSHNLANDKGGAIFSWEASTPTITNCILWNDSADIGQEIHNENGSMDQLNISHSNVDQEGFAWTNGNIRKNPVFRDPSKGDLHLQPGSPCIDTGVNDAVGGIVSDIDGDPRIYDGDYDGSEVVDMGADEFHVMCKGKLATIVGSNDDDVLIGTKAADVISGLAGRDLIMGLDGHDVVCAGSGDDLIYGGKGDDTLHGESGSDMIRAGSGHDHINGGAGSDIIIGGKGDDELIGGRANDVINGGGGNDRIWGGKGNDTIHGGAGDDTMNGQRGVDVCDGGHRGETWGDRAAPGCDVTINTP
jgi:predicted outer membrane repeat protein